MSFEGPWGPSCVDCVRESDATYDELLALIDDANVTTEENEGLFTAVES